MLTLNGILSLRLWFELVTSLLLLPFQWFSRADKQVAEVLSSSVNFYHITLLFRGIAANERVVTCPSQCFTFDTAFVPHSTAGRRSRGATGSADIRDTPLPTLVGPHIRLFGCVIPPYTIQVSTLATYRSLARICLQ